MTVRPFPLILSLSLLAATATAQQPARQAPRATERVVADTDRDVEDARVLRLSLDEALRTAMQQNLGVQLQRFDYSASGQSLRASYGIFDWQTTGTIRQSKTETPTITTFQPSSSKSTVANLGIAQLIPTGATYSVDWTNSRQTSAGGGTLVSPAYRSGLGLQFTQPLLRDFGTDVTRRGISIARNTLGITHEEFRSVLMDTASAVEQAYLDLIYARLYIDVVREALFLARDQSRITQIRIDVGASAPLYILQPRVQIATTEEHMILAVASVRNAEDRLRALMHLPPSEWDRPIVPTGTVGYTPVNVDAQSAVTRAFELRPEIRQTALVSDTRRVQAVYARNQSLPRFDFALDYSAAGLAGRRPEIDPVTFQPRVDPLTGQPIYNTTPYDRTLRQVFGNEFPAWTVGFNIGVPLLNVGARAEARRAQIELARSQIDAEQVRQNIAVQVRATVRAIDTTAKEIAATRAAREAAEQNLQAERRRYENGMTTNFQVLLVQQQLSDSRAREIQSTVAYNKAVAAYHRAVGDLLEVRNIVVEEPEKVDEPQLFSSFTRYNWLNYDQRSREKDEKK